MEEEEIKKLTFEYSYNVFTLIWPQIVRTVLEILLKGTDNMIALIGDKN